MFIILLLKTIIVFFFYYKWEAVPLSLFFFIEFTFVLLDILLYYVTVRDKHGRTVYKDFKSVE